MSVSPEVLLFVGPVLLFAMAFTETAVPAGLLVPAGVTLALAAFLAQQGLLPWLPVLAAAGTGALAGDSAGYWLARRGSSRFGRLPGPRGRLLRRARSAARGLLRSPPLVSVSLARSTSFVRTLMPAAVGMSGMPYLRFLAFDVAGVLVWLCLYVGLGVAAGESWRRVGGLVGTGWALLFLLLAMVAWAVARYRRRRDRPVDVPIEPVDLPEEGA